MTYKLLVNSNIKLSQSGNSSVTNELWARDINTNARAIERLTLMAPVSDAPPEAGWDAPLDPAIEVIDANALDAAGFATLLAVSDVAETSGNYPWGRSSLARRVAGADGPLSILALSSNRARTTVMNARGAGLPRRLRAAATARSIRISQRHLARRADAVRVVGEGLRPLVEADAKTLRVEVASWITDADIVGRDAPRPEEPRVVIASRLEPMKGVANGVDACAGLIAAGTPLRLEIAGVGAEEGALRARIDARGVADRARLIGQLGYPGPFYDWMAKADYVLLTNLNDELPRLIFDAAARGAIPVCPDIPGIRRLGLDPRLLYARGSVAALQAALGSLFRLDEAERAAIRDGLRALARSRTIEAMHADRRAWIEGLLAARG